MTYVFTPGPCTKIVIVRTMKYRSELLEEFSSDYTLAPPAPTSPQEWSAFIDAVRDAELEIYPPEVKWVRAYGYDSNDPHAKHVFLVDWAALGTEVSGTYTPGTGEHQGAGDQASVVQWRTDQISVKGKPIMFRKYHHHPYVWDTSPDALSTTYLNALQAYGNRVLTNQPPLYSTNHPNAKAQSATPFPWVTTRTLKRRGKRPVPLGRTGPAG